MWTDSWLRVSIQFWAVDIDGLAACLTSFWLLSSALLSPSIFSASWARLHSQHIWSHLTRAGYHIQTFNTFFPSQYFLKSSTFYAFFYLISDLFGDTELPIHCALLHTSHLSSDCMGCICCGSGPITHCSQLKKICCDWLQAKPYNNHFSWIWVQKVSNAGIVCLEKFWYYLAPDCFGLKYLKGIEYWYPALLTRF